MGAQASIASTDCREIPDGETGLEAGPKEEAAAVSVVDRLGGVRFDALRLFGERVFPAGLAELRFDLF